MEDERLALDSRAVAAWLAVKPAGWQVSVQALRIRLQVRKDRWQRMAGELEAAGYLIREKRQGAGGKWIWNIEFNPEPLDAPMANSIAGFSGSGVAASGEPAYGSAGAGGSGHKGLPSQDIPKSVNTTTTTTASNDVVRGCERRPGKPENIEPCGDRDLIFPPQLPPSERTAILGLLGSLASTEACRAQELLDELADAIETRAIRTTPLRWFRAVLKKLHDGNFVPLGAVRIKARREASEQQRVVELRTSDGPRSDPQIARPALDAIKQITQRKRGNSHA
ncbi:hypothetical protein [Burkholderia vietnamiensis]|uniref:hypothetical protein n=1 Tax=Burkholderia vietnamiensis TaxID=60552 RepID=UPI0012D8D36F|nr:hypothetical protein [Burkholderia vietnamiensis]MBR8034508.1 hypothetical protein [Burkholderia vietnamiensis]